MAAGLTLLPRKAFELTLEDGTIVQGQFGTWPLQRFTDKRKIPLSQVNASFSNMTLSDALDFVMCAIENKERELKKPPSEFFTEERLCKWVDDYEYETGNVDGLAKIINHASSEKKTEDTGQAEA